MKLPTCSAREITRLRRKQSSNFKGSKKTIGNYLDGRAAEGEGDDGEAPPPVARIVDPDE